MAAKESAYTCNCINHLSYQPWRLQLLQGFCGLFGGWVGLRAGVHVLDSVLLGLRPVKKLSVCDCACLCRYHLLCGCDERPQMAVYDCVVG